MNDEFLHNQLIRLGDLMGDGEHHQPGGARISKEYKKIFNALYPEYKKEKRAIKSAHTDKYMLKLIQEKTCTCGGELRQSRKGSKIAYCKVCNKRYKAISKKKDAK